MRKLHLIKPWGLVTVRQHLNDETERVNFVPVAHSCAAPLAPEEETFYLCRMGIANIRSGADTDGRAQQRIAAPVPMCSQPVSYAGLPLIYR